MEIILGSKSPRRKELLAGLGVQFSVVNIDADESYPDTLQGVDIPIYISRAKAAAYVDQLKAGQMLITSDTIVWLDGQVLGKPQDEEDAKRMIRLLSGHTHQVFTGVTVTVTVEKNGKAEQEVIAFGDRTDVTFRALTEEEIDYYVRTYQPLDKAGAYGIQEWIGYAACTKLEGSYFNVMGLPTEPLYEAIKPYL